MKTARRVRVGRVLLAMGLAAGAAAPLPAAPTDIPERVAIGADGRTFVLRPSGRRLRPWGVNSDHDRHGRLLEHYWEREWETVEQDFLEMRALGANVVRVHLQFGTFMDASDWPTPRSLERLARRLRLAERTGLYVDITGLGSYRREEVPTGYDELDEDARAGGVLACRRPRRPHEPRGVLL